MTIYIDLVFLLNLSFDFILLLTVDLVLKRRIKLIRIFIGSVIGSLSILILFLKISSLTLFLIKLIISILMILITFKNVDIKEFISNFITLYLVSILLGGFLYLLNLEFSYEHTGLIFYHKNISLNFVVLIILSPIVLYIYYCQSKSIKMINTYQYHVCIYLSTKVQIWLTAFLDTGNNLVDPITQQLIVLLPRKIIAPYLQEDKIRYVPFHTISGRGLLPCIKAKKIVVEGCGEINNILVGVSPQNFNLNGVECLLHSRIMENLK